MTWTSACHKTLLHGKTRRIWYCKHSELHGETMMGGVTCITFDVKIAILVVQRGLKYPSPAHRGNKSNKTTGYQCRVTSTTRARSQCVLWVIKKIVLSCKSCSDFSILVLRMFVYRFCHKFGQKPALKLSQLINYSTMQLLYHYSK